MQHRIRSSQGINWFTNFAFALPSSRPWVYEGLLTLPSDVSPQQGDAKRAFIFLECTGCVLDSEKEVSARWRKNVEQKTVGSRWPPPSMKLTIGAGCVRVVDVARHGRRRRAEAGHSQIPGLRTTTKRSKYAGAVIEAAAKRDLGLVLRRLGLSGSRLPISRAAVHPWKTDKEYSL